MQVPTLKVPLPVCDHVTVPVGLTGRLPVTVSVTVAVQDTVWVGATVVGVQVMVVVVGSSVTVIVDGVAVVLAACCGSGT